MTGRASISLFLLVLACGSKTGLGVGVPSHDAGVDVAREADVGVDAFDAGPQCIPFRAEARLAALDIFVLMDSSGSMEEETAAGVSKAAAITSALEGFVVAPESEGLGVGLTFFPFEDTSVREFCSNDDQCGEPGACFMPNICIPSGNLCRTAADCEMGDTCETLGRCGAPDDTEICFDIGSECAGGFRCVPLGFCENRTSCDVADYASPSVSLDLLPDNGPAIIDAMRSRELRGGTPTLPALEGSLSQARAWSEDNPGSKVILLLATDGFPAACDPSIDPFDPTPSGGIDALADAAAIGADEGIQTFVIGVFTPENERDARANLSRIAMAGGTDEALVITTADPVTEALLEILNELRLSVRTCVYAIPHEGVLPDPFALEVRILPPEGAPLELTRVDGADACDPMTGGFYFQRDIAMGARPGFIELCPASCSLTAASADFVVEMQAGCEP